MLYYLQGILIGIAYTAPIGMQNLFVINTALTHDRNQALQIALIIVFFDMTLSLSCFWGIGILLEYSPLLKSILIGAGSIFLLHIGINLIKMKTTAAKSASSKTSMRKIISTACFVTWFNPQAILDGTLMLGSFHAVLDADAAVLFIFGIISASFFWFTGLTVFTGKFSNKINACSLTKINRCCGVIIILYAVKLISEINFTFI
ncbi:LysE family transporter [Pectinatus haikarae]|uniref:L-lysine exporter family protein LysE/ArgO n=2 Tax=Pectinatus haikarae TaxID=349096 RepID=A0ABT9Y3L1_9FIRM|nr:L-lysine exporter family protein LysE/ArgO [Pectinatus haikarae]